MPIQKRRWRPGVETRCEILTAAEHLFEQQGYNRTSVANIAAAVGISPANIYRHFDTKLAILDGVADQRLRQVDAALDALPADRTAAERLRKIVRLIARHNEETLTQHGFIREIMTATLYDEPQSVEAFRARLRARFESLIAQGIEGGEFANKDPTVAAANVVDALAQVLDPLLLSRRFRPESAFHLEAQIDRLLEFTIAALRMPFIK